MDPEQDLSHIHWSFPEHIAALPSGTLSHPDQALDYFALSPFFDPQSNNGKSRTQRSVQAAAAGYIYGHHNEKPELLRFIDGFEYVVGHSQPPRLFVIHQRTVREDKTATDPRKDGLPNTYRENPSGMWFVQDGKVYPTPSLYGVVAARLKNASSLVASTFSTLSHVRPASNPRANLAWRAVDGTAESLTAATEAGEDANGEQEDVDSAGVSSAGPNAEAGPSRARTAKSPGDEDEDAEDQAPDMQLLAALHSTSMAMADLAKRSAEQSRPHDPKDELRRIEMQMLGTTAPGGSARDRAVSGHGRLGAVRAQHGGAGSSPMSSTMGQTSGRPQASSPIGVSAAVASTSSPSYHLSRGEILEKEEEGEKVAMVDAAI